MDNGNRAKISRPYHQVENETAIDASSTTRDKTPAMTAFLMFRGELSAWALTNGRKTAMAKTAKYNNGNKTLSVYRKATDATAKITVV